MVSAFLCAKKKPLPAAFNGQGLRGQGAYAAMACGRSSCKMVRL